MRRKRYNLKQSVSFAIRPDLLQKIDKVADTKNVSRSQLVEQALQIYLLMEDGGGKNGKE